MDSIGEMFFLNFVSNHYDYNYENYLIFKSIYLYHNQHIETLYSGHLILMESQMNAYTRNVFAHLADSDFRCLRIKEFFLNTYLQSEGVYFRETFQEFVKKLVSDQLLIKNFYAYINFNQELYYNITVDKALMPPRITNKIDQHIMIFNYNLAVWEFFTNLYAFSSLRAEYDAYMIFLFEHLSEFVNRGDEFLFTWLDNTHGLTYEEKYELMHGHLQTLWHQAKYLNDISIRHVIIESVVIKPISDD